MIRFLLDNISTIIVSAVLAALIVLALVRMYKDKKAGKSACSCKCSGCPDSYLCHGEGKKKR